MYRGRIDISNWDLTSQVTETNPRDEILDRLMKHRNNNVVIPTIAGSIFDEAVWPNLHSPPPNLLAEFCNSLRSPSLRQMLNYTCQEEFKDANFKTRDSDNIDPDQRELASFEILNIVTLVGELYKLGLAEDKVVEFYLKGLRRDLHDIRSVSKADAMCLLLHLIAHRYKDPGDWTIDVGPYVRSLLDYAKKCGLNLPANLKEEIREIAQFHTQSEPSTPSPNSGSSSYPPRSNSTQLGQSSVPPRWASASTNIPDVTDFIDYGGDVDLICRSDDRCTIFRVDRKYLASYSLTLPDPPPQDRLYRSPASNSWPQIIHCDDDPTEFFTLMEVIHGNKKLVGSNQGPPPFPEFASLLRLSTKYKIHTILDMLIVHLTIAYEWDSPLAVPIGRKYFGDPEPHPNEVLKLFQEFQMGFALPFASYEACAAGIVSLTVTDPTVMLPPIPLSQAVREFYELKKMEWGLALRIQYLDREFHTSYKCRPVRLGLEDPVSPLQDVLRAINPNMSQTGFGGILLVPDFSIEDNCADCVREWNDLKNEAKVKLWEYLSKEFGTKLL